jgi:hypothetical protein
LGGVDDAGNAGEVVDAGVDGGSGMGLECADGACQGKHRPANVSGACRERSFVSHCFAFDL